MRCIVALCAAMLAGAAQAQTAPTLDDLRDAYALCFRHGFDNPAGRVSGPAHLPADEQAACLEIRNAMIKKSEDAITAQRPTESKQLIDMQKRLKK